MIRELAGIHAPHGELHRERLARCLGERAATFASGTLAVAFTGGRAPGAAGGALCLLDGELHHTSPAGSGAPSAERGCAQERLVASTWRRDPGAIPGTLRGPFALLLWDPERERGMLARDHLGLRPLFVCESGGVLRFASELRLLLSMLPRRPAPDDVAAVNWLARGGAGRGRTLYEGIRALAPGRLLELDVTGAAERRYWQPWRLPVARLSRQEATEAVGDAVARAVSARIGGGGEVAAELSGGIDSASVTAVARRLGAPLRAYSAEFPDDAGADESELVDLVTSGLRIPSVRMSVERCGALAPALRFLERWEVPLGPGTHFVWEALLRRAVADGARSTLNGQGGDELFGAPVYLLADRLMRGRVEAAYRLSGRIPGMGAAPPARIRHRAVKLWGIRGALPHRLHRTAWRRRAPNRHAPRLLSPAGARLFTEHHDPYPWKATPAPRWRAERLDLLSDGADAMGVHDYLRRRGADAGIDSREPFLDVDLVELMMRIPPELSFDPELSRPLLRGALDGLLDDRVRLRPGKSAFDGVLTRALTGPDSRAVREILTAPSLEIGAWVEPRILRESMLERPPAAHPGGADAWAKAAWRLATLELWLRSQDEPSFAARALDRLPVLEPRCTFRSPDLFPPCPPRALPVA